MVYTWLISAQIPDWKVPHRCQSAHAHRHHTLAMTFYCGYYNPGYGLRQTAELMSDSDPPALRVNNYWPAPSSTHTRLVNNIFNNSA